MKPHLYQWTKKGSLLLLIAMILVSCKQSKTDVTNLYKANDTVFDYHGRLLKNDDQVVLIGSASGFEFNALGDSLELMLKSDNGSHNYFSLSIDGKYHNRYQISSDSINKITIALMPEEAHEIGIYKATEAANGPIVFYGAKTRNISHPKLERTTTMEFIGNSITCGMGADLSSVPCGEGEWFDQHNAYLAYGPRVARSLNADYLLSSVSGIGMYRNWNDENLNEPIMPEVYDNLFLNTDTSHKYSFDDKPDIICICLGTNDMSDGDGTKPRLPFNKEKFVQNYTKFVEHLFGKNPEAKMVLLTSPMVSGDKGKILLESLKEVKGHFGDDPKISIFQFGEMQPNGCTSHPDIEDHKTMADQLEPFLKKRLE
ncbi:GDSL-type esterase/lipase family protein [Flagellimonas sp.]|uniref:SGNH/GDSL hydrolase family protein n=1 Tax=Flagellimonas sp. TaxID=2058762 RepID=UPI003BB01975